MEKRNISNPTGSSSSLQDDKKKYFQDMLADFLSNKENNMRQNSHSKQGIPITTISSLKQLETGSIMGGDYAGLEAKFDPQNNGTLIPIPERLVPHELIQWGQVPNCLQILTRETTTTTTSEDDQKEADEDHMQRSKITVLPDIGCSIDHLQTLFDDAMIVDLSSSSSSSFFWEEINTASLHYTLDNDKMIRFETIFGLLKENNHYRVRVVVDVQPSTTTTTTASDVFSLLRPIVLSMERPTTFPNNGSLKNLAEDLDGRTLSDLLGPELRKSKTFVDEPIQNDGSDNTTTSTTTCLQQLNFPGNISVAYGWQQKNVEWVLNVCHCDNDSKRVVSNRFKLDPEIGIEFHAHSWAEKNSESSN